MTLENEKPFSFYTRDMQKIENKKLDIEFYKEQEILA